jgi:hypothetical protein
LWVTRFAGKLDSRVTDYFRFHLEARVWNQNSMSGAQTSHGEFRELWFNLELDESTEIRAGKQLVTWGRADGLNPTDLINPKDLTRLVSEESDQKLGTWLLGGTRYFGHLSITGLWITDFEPSVFPLPPLASGAALARELPDHRAAQGALKVETTGGRLDASISYFDGYDHLPDLTFSGSTITLFFPRIRVVGADAAGNLGRFGARAEASYTFQDKSVGGPLPPRRNVLSVVAGADRSFFEYLNVNVQYLGRYVPGFKDPDGISDSTTREFAHLRALLIQEQARIQNGMSARVSYKWLHETLETEVRGVTWFKGGDYLLSPRASYALSDFVKVSLGADFYNGPARSILGFQERNSLGFAELKYGF